MGMKRWWFLAIVLIKLAVLAVPTGGDYQVHHAITALPPAEQKA
jgi:hypothetical protein